MKRAAQPDEMNMTGIVVGVRPDRIGLPGCTMSAWTDPLEVRTETVGYALPARLQCQIVDPETGEEMPDGQIGEFVSARLQHHEGLLQDARRHRSTTMDENGWLHSGDLLHDATSAAAS